MIHKKKPELYVKTFDNINFSTPTNLRKMNYYLNLTMMHKMSFKTLILRIEW